MGMENRGRLCYIGLAYGALEIPVKRLSNDNGKRTYAHQFLALD